MIASAFYTGLFGRLMTASILCLAFPAALQAQHVITESFEDGNFNTAPAWGGHADSFLIVQDGGTRWLRLNGAGTNVSSYLQTASSGITGTWEGLVRLDFNPSSSNYARVYVLSDQPDLSGPLNGYFLEFGRLNDEISLYRQQGTAVTRILDGTDNTLNTATVRVRFRLSRNEAGLFSLETDLSGGTTFAPAGTVTDATFQTAAAFGVVCRYTSTRNKQFFFDDFAWPDPPFRLLRVTMSARSELEVLFNKTLNPATVVPSVFTLSGAGSPGQVQASDRTAVLTFATPPPGGRRLLSVSTGLRSDQGDSLESGFQSGPVVLHDSPAPGDLVLNEVLFDPPAGLGDYIELRNTTASRYFLLQQMRLADASTQTVITSPVLLGPGDYAVVSADTSALAMQFGRKTWIQAPGLPAFNSTSADAVVLRTADGMTLDSLTYQPGWGQPRKSLERRSASVRSTARANWGAGTAATGSPGSANTVAPDLSPPVLLSVTQPSATALTLRFSEELDAAAVLRPESYSLNQGVSVQQIRFQVPDTVQLTLTGVSPEVPFRLTISGLTDLFGNAFSGSFPLEWVPTRPPRPGDVVINEFMYDPPPAAQDYVELWNRSDRNIRLDSLLLADATLTFRAAGTAGAVLRAGRMTVVARDSALLQAFPGVPLTVLGSAFPSLNNTGQESIVLRSASALLDSVTWNAATRGGSRVSIERRSPSVPAGFAANWLPSTAAARGTPGAANTAQPDTTRPAAVRLLTADAQTLDVLFDEDLDPAHLSGITASINGGITVNIITQPDARLIRLQLLQPLQHSMRYTVTVSGARDIFGNLSRPFTGSFTHYTTGTALPGSVRINEFMYDPVDGFTEFVEVVNVSSTAFDLNGWKLNDQGGTPRSISQAPFILPPDSMVVLAPDSSIARLRPGLRILTMGAAFPSLNNASDRIVLRAPSGLVLDSVSYVSAWGGSGRSVERRSTTVSSHEPDNWGSSPAPGFATPGMPNALKPPVGPPAALRASALRPDTLVFEFERSVQAGPAFSVRLDPAAPVRAFLFSGRTLRLVPQVPLSDRQQVTVQVSGVSDLFGNVAASQSFTLVYYAYQQARAGDVLLTEFMYDPPAGQPEYVELENRGNVVLDLSTLRFSDNTPAFRSLSPQIRPFLPGARAVLTSDSALARQFPDRLVLVLTGMPALANTAEALVVKNASGMTLDSLFYTAAWGGREVSLERRSMALPAVLSVNWGPSPAPEKGTPGLENRILPDTRAPVVVAADPAGDSLLIHFDEPLPPEQPDVRFTLPAGFPAITGSFARGTRLVAALSSPLPATRHFPVSLQGVRDWFGNALGDTTVTVANPAYGNPAAESLVLNEIQFRGSDADPEFVEILNAGSEAVDLSGWTLSDESGSVTLRPLLGKTANGLRIPLLPDSMLVLTASPSLAARLSNGFFVSGLPNFANAGDAVVLKSPDGTVADSVQYRESWAPGSPGVSLERRDPGGLSNDPGNWTSGPAGGTPGRQNASYRPDAAPPVLRFANIKSGHIQLHFDEFVQLPADGLALNGAGVTVSGGAGFSRMHAVPLPAEIRPYEPVQIRVSGVRDAKGNTAGLLETDLSWPAAPGRIVINEILHNPIADPRDGRPDQAEFVELFNPGAAPVSLEGIRLQTPRDEQGRFTILAIDSTRHRALEAGAWAVLHADTAQLFRRSRTAVFFGLEDGRAFFRSKRTTLGLGASSGTVILADSTGLTVDSVAYNDTWHNPNLRDVRGRSLERIRPAGASHSALNWGTSTEASGATPGRRNTLFRETASVQDPGSATLSPNPFSPDNDGFEDFCQIAWRFEEPSLLLRIRIFDRYGRLVRTLADGFAAGFEGSAVWDGNGDDRRTVRPGLYIVLMEASGTGGKTVHTFKKTVAVAPGR